MTPSTIHESAEHRAWRQELLALKGLYEEAIATSNPELLHPYFLESSSAVFLTDKVAHGFGEVLLQWDRLKRLLGPGGATMTLEYEPSEFHGNIALARGTYVFIANGLGLRFPGNWTAVVLRTDDGWKILRIHASMDPICNPFINQKIAAFALGAGGAGLLLGSFMGSMKRR